jgi:single-stranded-DNA-specific exonuclease
MYFSNSPSTLGIYNGDIVDVIFNIDVNEWLGRRNVQLIVKDIRLSKSQGQVVDSERTRFDEIWNGAPFTTDEDVLPTRDDCAAFYRYVASSLRSGCDTFAHRELSSKLMRTSAANNIGYIKLKIIIKIFQELNLIGIEEIDNEVYKFTLHYSTSKTDLEKSNLLRRLRSQQRRTEF